MSQPRKIAAVTIAQRVANERKTSLGVEIGYQVGLDKKSDMSGDERSKIVFCTTGVILQRLVHEQSMKRYSHIIIDEVHERDVDIDFLLLIIRRMMSLDSTDTKIILMSATMAAEQFSEYFEVTLNNGSVYAPPIIDLSESPRNFEIKEYYLEEFEDLCVDNPVSELIDYEEPGISEGMYEYAATILTLCFKMQMAQVKKGVKSPAILVFLPGIHEIERFHEKISLGSFSKYLAGINVKTEICILHSMLSVDEQRAAFTVNDKSKIILSTNIAESSVTIPNVTHVLDFCLTKNHATAKGAQISSLILEWSSQNNCKQRSGRCGRICNGVVVRLVSLEFYDKKMRVHPIPEMTRTALEPVVIKTKLLQMGSPLEMLALAPDPPEEESIVDAVLHLKELGALSRFSRDGTFDYLNGDLTFVGRVMGSLGVDVRVSKFIIVGYMLSVLEEVVIIGAGLNLKSVFLNSYNDKIDNYVKKLSWAHGTGSDCIAILVAYRLWKKYQREKQHSNLHKEIIWCKENNLDYKNLREMELLINEIEQHLQKFKIQELPANQPTWKEHEKIFVIKMCIAGAFGAANFFQTTKCSQTDERDAFRAVNCLDLFRTVYFKSMDRTLVGEVYEQRIREEFKRQKLVDDISTISCTFDPLGEKVFVTFRNNQPLVETDDFNDNVGNILPEVYRSVKLRQIQGHIILPVMRANKTEEYAIKQGLGSIVEGKFKKKSVFIENPSYCILPTNSMIKIHGFVTHVEHCNKFFYRPFKAFTDQGHSDNRYRVIYETILATMKESELKPATEPKVGQNVVLAKTKKYHRGVLVSRDGPDSVTVKLIDVGCILDNVDLANVYLFTKKDKEDFCFSFPPRVFECTLTEVQPSWTNGCYVGKWTKEAIEAFKTVVERKSTIHIYSVVNDVVSVKLIHKDINWNLKLIEEGFAEECEESYLSKMNHEHRRQRQIELVEPMKPEEEFATKIDENLAIGHVEAPPIGDCKFELKLNGPFSPLETDLFGISRLVTNKITVDRQSVNSVILSDDILNYRGKFCVAANMTVNAASNRITLRETTMMPNSPGLAALLALIFSPTAELRRDKNGSRYVSLLTGLGFDRVRCQPYYGERDSLIDIDFELTESDIEIINQLRFALSEMLFVQPGKLEPDLVDGDKETLLKHIQSLIIKIIVKQRPVMETCSANDAFDWNNDQVDAVFRADSHGLNGTYTMIGIPKLKKMSEEEKEKLLRHDEELKSCVNGVLFMSKKVCRLCNFEWSSAPELKLHLLSKKHITQFERLS